MIRFLQKEGRVQRLLLVFFLGLVSVTMVMYLVPGFQDAFSGGASSPDVVAKVAGRDITLQDVQRTAQNMARRQFGRQAPPQLMAYFSQQAADTLITQNVFLAEAHRLGLDATNQELINELQHGGLADQLYPEGKFIGSDQYANFVQSAFSMPVARFEQLVKEDITTRKLRNLIEGGATVAANDVRAEYLRQNTKVKIDYAFFTLESLAKSITPSDAELKAFYEKNQQALANAIPEQRKARYIVVDTAHMSNAPQVSDADLQNYYNQHREEFRVAESVKVRHILIATGQPGQKPDQKTVDAAKAKAEDVMKQLKGGAKFADLAKKYSDDPGSKANGGELGVIERGRTVKAFEDAAFGAKPGDVVGPVQSEFGFHIIQVEDKTEAHTKSLAEVRSQIEPIIARDKGRAALDQLAKNVESQARTQGIEKAAQQNNLQIVTTDFVDRGAPLPGVGPAPAVSDYIFANQPNSNPTAVQTTAGWVIAQTTDVKPARTPTFEEAKSRLAQQYAQQRAQAMLAQKTQELADKAHALHNLKDAAKQLNATFKSSDFLTPSQQVPDLGVLGNLIDPSTLKQGEISGPINAGQSGAVIQMVDKQQPGETEFASAQGQVREQLLARKRNELIEVYVSSAREKMQKAGKIKIFEKNMQRLQTANDNAGQ